MNESQVTELPGTAVATAVATVEQRVSNATVLDWFWQPSAAFSVTVYDAATFGMIEIEGVLWPEKLTLPACVPPIVTAQKYCFVFPGTSEYGQTVCAESTVTTGKTFGLDARGLYSTTVADPPLPPSAARAMSGPLHSARIAMLPGADMEQPSEAITSMVYVWFPKPFATAVNSNCEPVLPALPGVEDLDEPAGPTSENEYVSASLSVALPCTRTDSNEVPENRTMLTPGLPLIFVSVAPVGAGLHETVIGCTAPTAVWHLSVTKNST